MRRFVSVLTIFVLGACASPYERCVAVQSKDLRVVRALVEQTEANITRGYAFEEKTKLVAHYGFCVGRYHTRGCARLRERTVERPVAIDLDSERKKLATLKVKERELAHKAVAAEKICRATYQDNL